jgi:hypothetical protein
MVTRHYAGDGGLGDRIYERLRSLGFEGQNPLSPKDTAAVDQFHVGGFEATEKLAQLLCPSRESYVLDVGSGLGGPSPYLAAKYGWIPREAPYTTQPTKAGKFWRICSALHSGHLTGQQRDSDHTHKAPQRNTERRCCQEVVYVRSAYWPQTCGIGRSNGDPGN